MDRNYWVDHIARLEPGRTAIRRMNQMHGAYPISNDDKRYVLCTFVTSPIRWIDRYGWRRLTELEKTASANYYRELGRHMNIKDRPATYQQFAEHLDAYEREHFGFDPGARAVADATLELLNTFPPNDRLPPAVVRRMSYALMDDPLLDAFGYRRPAPWERRLAEHLFVTQATVETHLRHAFRKLGITTRTGLPVDLGT